MKHWLQNILEVELALVAAGMVGRLVSGLILRSYLLRSEAYRNEGGSAMDWLSLRLIRRGQSADAGVPDWVFFIANTSMIVWVLGLLLLLLDLIGLW